MKRMCFSCEKRPARKLKTKRKHYANAAKEAIFCTQACAADWALLQADSRGNPSLNLYFCREHGWDEDSEVECGKCDSQRYSNYLEKKRDLVRKRYAQAQEDESSIKREARKYWESWMLDPKTKTHWKV